MSGMGIYGLSGSGIDVDSMVRMGMMSKQNQYDKMYKEEVKNEWVKEAYTNMYSSLNTFNSSTLYNYKLSSTTSPMNASSSDTKVATATANADAAQMSHTVNVSKLASNAYLLTADKIARQNQDLSESIYLKDILFTSEEQSALRAGVPTDPDEAEKYLDKELLSFDIADGIESTSTKKTISFSYREIMDNNLTINDVVSRINQSGVNIKAAYDSANDAFSLYQKDGGVDNKIMLTVKNEGVDPDDPTKLLRADSAAGNGARLLNNLQMASVTQSEDENHNLISKLSDKFTVQVAQGVSSIGGAQNSYTSQTVVGEGTTLDSLFKASKDNTNAAPIKFNLISTSEDGSTSYTKEISLDASKTIKDLMDAIGEEDDSHLGDFIEDNEAIVPPDAASFSMLQEQLGKVLDGLAERERKVISLRFGLEDGHPRTLEEVGREFGVTRERIRQIESKTLAKLRHPSRSSKLKDYLED